MLIIMCKIINFMSWVTKSHGLYTVLTVDTIPLPLPYLHLFSSNTQMHCSLDITITKT